MASEKEIIIRQMHLREFSRNTIEFDEVVAEIAKTALGHTHLEAEAYVTKNVKRLWNDLLESLGLDKRLGRAQTFHVVDPFARRLQWIPSANTTTRTSRERVWHLKLRSLPYMLRMIDGLSPREYEALGCFVAEMVGAEQFKLTPSGNEGGIDFFALINNPAKCHLLAGECRPLRIVGQSKKYSTRIESNKVKEFIQTLNELKEQNPTVERHVPTWFRTTTGPVIGWIITHNGAQSGAITRAQNHGILIFDSRDIAEIAATSRSIPVTLIPESRAKMLLNLANALTAHQINISEITKGFRCDSSEGYFRLDQVDN
jgi:hypothetical protein